jgi:hypothetical protein
MSRKASISSGCSFKSFQASKESSGCKKADHVILANDSGKRILAKN